MGAVIMRWVWLEYMCVFSGCSVKRYIDFLLLLIPVPLVLIALFCCNIHTSLFIFKMIFHSCINRNIAKIWKIAVSVFTSF